MSHRAQGCADLRYGSVPENGFIGRSQFFTMGFLDFQDNGAIATGDDNLNWCRRSSHTAEKANLVTSPILDCSSALRRLCLARDFTVSALLQIMCTSTSGVRRSG